jgi:hypothetical protein
MDVWLGEVGQQMTGFRFPGFFESVENTAYVFLQQQTYTSEYTVVNYSIIIWLYIYRLFNCVINNFRYDYISLMVGRYVGTDLKVKFPGLIQDTTLRGGEDNHKAHGQDRLCPDRGFDYVNYK